MDRKDLLKAKQAKPDLVKVWTERLHRIEQERQKAHNAWRQLANKSDTAARRESAAIYHAIDRCDRTISFLDRALLHLDDIDHGTRNVDAIHPVELRGS